MAYFLKKTTYSKGLYLQIYESYYDKKSKVSRHKCFKKLGYVKDLTNDKIKDPIDYYNKEVITLNKKRINELNEAKVKKIGGNPIRNFGYFLVKEMFNTLGLKNEMKAMNMIYGNSYLISSLVEALTYSRIVAPCSKLKTFEEVLPILYEEYKFSLDQIYDGINFIGDRYSQFIEIMNQGINNVFSRNTKATYFDCTNYYFEIDFENEDKQKGPSKENRPNPIIGQALLLDQEGIPLGMKMYPGNESEKPKIREIISTLKKQNKITGKTIQVADKGLNCSDNIYEAIKNKDGYIFSQSVLKLEEKEKNWILLDNDYEDIKDSNGNIIYKIKSCIDKFPIYVTSSNGKKEKLFITQKRVATFNPSLANKKKFEINKLIDKAKSLCFSQAKKEEYGEASKYVMFIDEKGKKANTIINQEKIDKDLRFAGYNLIVTSEIKMHKEEIYKIYHNLWKIEDTFRILKTHLQARPIYLQKKESIYGHFLICYYAVTLLRLLEEKIFKNIFSVYELKNIIRNLNIVKGENSNTNLTTRTPLIDTLCSKYNFKVDYYYLESKEIDKLFRYSYKIKK